MSGILHDVKSFDVRHIQHHLADVEGGEVIEVCRRGRPVARIVPLASVPPRSADWRQAEKRWLAAYPTPVGGVTAAQTIVDGRGDRLSLCHDSGVLVKLCVREEYGATVARFLAARGEAVIVNNLRESVRRPGRRAGEPATGVGTSSRPQRNAPETPWRRTTTPLPCGRASKAAALPR